MESGTPPPPPTASRHGCLLAYLVFMIIVNVLTTISYLAMGGQVIARFPSAPPGISYLFAIGCAINVALAVALLAWRKWAFYGFCAMAVIILGVNIYIGVNPVFALLGLIGPAILYGVLQIGGERKGWKFLK